MSKRIAEESPSSHPAKFFKEDVEPAFQPPEVPTAKPVYAGPKARVLQSYVLTYKPRIEVAISLNGTQAEVRFASPDSVFYITGDELMQLANQRADLPKTPVFLANTRVEPLQDGFRFARYGKDQSHDFFPLTTFDVPKCAVSRLLMKLDLMCVHVANIHASERAITEMYNSIVKAYKEEFLRIHSFESIPEQFNHLDRLIECYTPTVSIVRDFTSRLTDACRFNHYNLCAIALAQKEYIHSLLE